MRPVFAIRAFLRLEAAGGILLMAAAVLAMVLANSPLGGFYDALLDSPVAVQVGALKIAKPLVLWINDGLMAVFFLLVGLEIKREVMVGQLSTLARAALPGIAAIGGMVVPALVYVAITLGDPAALHGWAIPAATDIAFALGVFALLGRRAPVALKVFLLALAIMDDLGAIVIIALFYAGDLSLEALALAAFFLVALAALNLAGVIRLAPYVIVGVLLWVCVLKSGVHATLAGVALGLAVPLRTPPGAATPPLRQLEHSLHPWVAYGILPLFAFANAGVSLTGLSPAVLLAPIPLGIALGLFLGKQIGVVGATWLALRWRLAALPPRVTWTQFYGTALLTGIGFTMSLFIGTLAFPDPAYADDVRIGVLAGSLLSAVSGFLVLFLGAPRQVRQARDVVVPGFAPTLPRETGRARGKAGG